MFITILTCEPQRQQHDHADTNVEQLGPNHLVLRVVEPLPELLLGGALPLVLVPVLVWEGAVDILHHVHQLVEGVAFLFELLRREQLHHHHGHGMEEQNEGKSYECPLQCEARVQRVWRLGGLIDICIASTCSIMLHFTGSLGDIAKPKEHS